MSAPSRTSYQRRKKKLTKIWKYTWFQAHRSGLISNIPIAVFCFYLRPIIERRDLKRLLKSKISEWVYVKSKTDLALKSIEKLWSPCFRSSVCSTVRCFHYPISVFVTIFNDRTPTWKNRATIFLTSLNYDAFARSRKIVFNFIPSKK